MKTEPKSDIEILPIGEERMEILREALEQNSRILAMNFQIIETILQSPRILVPGNGELNLG